MHRINTPNKAPDLFGAGKHEWRDGDKATGINATEFNAAFLNTIQEELAGIPEAAGLVLGEGSGQILQALNVLFAPKNMDFGTLP